ncbi:MAG TPA: hypothetical protein VMZ53_05825 [Kofleriaceae bacterium]|nr:hypothetical protein [Kofleriaceae bacterium]
MSENATVTLTRTGYAGAVTLNVTGLPAGVTADPLTIGAGADSGTLVLRSTAAAVLGSSAMATVTGDGSGAMKSAMVQVYVQGPHGSLDTTFGTGGKAIVPLGTATNGDSVHGVVVMQNGDIVAVGGGSNATGAFGGAIALTPAGQVDTSMFNQGKHVGVYTGGSNMADHFFAATLQPDGKILAAGFAGIGGQSHFYLLARFTTLGVLDTSFGLNSSGFNVTDFDPAAGDDAKAYNLAVKPDGSIVAGGFYATSAATFGTTARYTSAGTLVGRLPAVPPTFQAAVGARADNSVIAVGVQGTGLGIARYTAADGIDTTFGNGTGATTAVLRNAGSDIPGSIIVLPDNKFYVGAYTKNGTNYEAALARFTDAGTLDTTFAGGTGFVTTPTNSPTNWDKIAPTALLPDGSVVLAYTLAGTTNDFAWVHVKADGTIDGASNVVSTDFASGSDFVGAVTVQPDGRIVLAGTAAANGRNNFAVARYWP